LPRGVNEIITEVNHRWEARPLRENITRHENFVAERDAYSERHFISFLCASRREILH